jgi:hypothetical protein
MNKLPLPVQSAVWWLLPLVALAVMFGLETDWGRAVEPRPQPAEVIEPKPVATALLPEYEIAGGMAGRTETVERTLFNPTRRPAPSLAQEGGGGPGQMKRGQFALTGTMLIEGKNTAFLREIAGNKSRHVRAGETINGMRVAEVKPDRVTFTVGGESEELVLKVATNPRPTPVPVIAATPQPAQTAAAAPAPGQAIPPAATAAAAANTGAPQTALERRRAARAAAAAAAGANGGTVPPGSSNPNSNPWDSVNQAYQQRAGGQNQQQK